MDIMWGYDESGNKVLIYTVASAVFTDETLKKTVANALAEQINEIKSINTNITNLKNDALTASDITSDFVDDNTKVVDASTLKSFRDNTLCFKGTLTTQDLDTLNETGYYLIGDATNITHLPTDITSNYNNSIVVVIANNNNVHQKIIRLGTNEVSTRSKKTTTTFTTPWQSNLMLKATIPNKSKTSLTLPNSMGSINYFIEDGWCTVEFKDIAGDTTNIDIIETEELPTPNLTQPCFLESDGVMVGTIYIAGKTSGSGVKITAHKNSATLGFGTISYKIDQSKF